MFLHASVILFTIGLKDTRSLLVAAVGTHPTGMFLCVANGSSFVTCVDRKFESLIIYTNTIMSIEQDAFPNFQDMFCPSFLIIFGEMEFMKRDSQLVMISACAS